MPTDLTGPPTPLGIGKYNVDADAPSGLGFNAAMDEIDALIAGRVAKPSGIVAGEAMIYNGSGFDRSSVTRLVASGITGLTLVLTGTAGSANTDLTLSPGGARSALLNLTAGGGNVRSIQSSSVQEAGFRLILRNTSGSNITLSHNLAGGSGATLLLKPSSDAILAPNDILELFWDGTNWVEVDRELSWSPYVPVWTASTTNPTLGNSTLTGRFTQFGKTIQFRVDLTIGSSGFVAGSGSYEWTLPVAPTTGVRGVGRYYAVHAAAAFTGDARINTTPKLDGLTSAGSPLSPTVPFTWAAGDTIVFTGTYEAA